MTNETVLGHLQDELTANDTTITALEAAQVSNLSLI